MSPRVRGVKFRRFSLVPKTDFVYTPHMSKPEKPAEAPYDYREDPELIKAVKEGIADLDAGRTIPYEKVRRWLLSWGTENELPPPDENE